MGRTPTARLGRGYLERQPTIRIVLANNGYDSDAIRRQIEAMEAAPNISPKVDRYWKPCSSPVLYRGRYALERLFGQLKNFCRIDKLYSWIARNYLAVVCLAATVCCWL